MEELQWSSWSSNIDVFTLLNWTRKFADIKNKLGYFHVWKIWFFSLLHIKGHRYPILNSGDLIALRVAATSGSLSQRWLYCSTSYCSYTTCHGTHMYSSSWGSCSSYMIFKIIAMGKMDGQPINSGDTVTLMNKAYGYTSSYHIRCYVSQSSACRMSS